LVSLPSGATHTSLTRVTGEPPAPAAPPAEGRPPLAEPGLPPLLEPPLLGALPPVPTDVLPAPLV
jgi:hypothetical protein